MHGRNIDYPMPYQGKMMKSALFSMEEDARHLRAMLQDGDQLPLWLHYKVAVAENNLDKVARYLRYHLGEAQARSNPAGAADQAQAIQRLRPRLAKDLRSKDPVRKLAAQQLTALLLRQPDLAEPQLVSIIEKLKFAGPETLGAQQHKLMLGATVRALVLWRKAQA